MAPQAGVADRELQRYLAPGERVVTLVHQHWFALAPKIGAAVAATLLAFYIDLNASATPAGSNAVNLGWALWLASLAWLAWGVLNWRRDWFVATDKRLLMFYGFIRRKVAMMPMLKVTDMTFDRSPLGRLLGYGTFILESAGQEQALARIEYVPDADEHYRRICGVLFGTTPPVPARPGPGDVGGWDGGSGGGGRDGGGQGGGGSPVPPPVPYAGQHARPAERPSTGPPRRPEGLPPGDGHAHRGDDPFDWDSDTGPGAVPPSETLYRSEDLVRSDRRADTGEIPVVRPIRLPHAPEAR